MYNIYIYTYIYIYIYIYVYILETLEKRHLFLHEIDK